MDEYRRYGRRQLLVSDRGSPPVERFPVPSRAFWSSYRVSAIAASLVLLISFGVWQGVQPEPETNVLLVDLFAVGSTRGEPDEPVVDFAGGASSCLFLIHHPDLDLSSPTYHAVIKTADGRERFWSGDLRPSAFDTFRLSVPRDFLDSGDYVLTLYGGPEPLREFNFSVR